MKAIVSQDTCIGLRPVHQYSAGRFSSSTPTARRRSAAPLRKANKGAVQEAVDACPCRPSPWRIEPKGTKKQ